MSPSSVWAWAIPRWRVQSDSSWCPTTDKTGESVWSKDESKALLFETKMDAWKFWAQTLQTDPIRPDGQPNRPLTAFSVMIEEVKA